MSRHYSNVMFTPSVKQAQEENGSRRAYKSLERPDTTPEPLTQHEITFIRSRDSLYMASVSETGWPYIQHRGGPRGFIKVLSENEIGIADYSGNRQYITVGNISSHDRVALILVDYPNRRRLKLIGRMRIIERTDPRFKSLEDEDPPAERGLIISVEGTDWNCPQYITPRFTVSELEDALEPVREQIRQLERENQELRERLKSQTHSPISLRER
ncbi:MAG: pyridoxamine 5'-phosphate oxidase family protein [Hyphomicrobium sp.]|nr:pyridoxamine 5'-phosphate oxidase family protein [Hyphomicrobium sp.]